MGMEEMAVCLDNLVGKRFWNLKGGFRSSVYSDVHRSYSERSQKIREKEIGMKPSWKMTIETKRSLGEAVGSMKEIHFDGVPKRNWKDAVIVVRLSAFIPWSRIQFGLSSLLKSHHVLCPYKVDKAVIWSNSVEDKNTMEGMGICNIPGVGKVRFERRKSDSQFTNLKAICNKSWIGH